MPTVASSNYLKLRRFLSHTEIVDYYRICDSPLHSGLLYSFVRYADYDDTQINVIRYESIAKEINVMCKRPRPPELDFSYFSTRDPETLLHYDVPYDDSMRSLVRDKILGWVEKCKGMVLYPKTSTKTCSLSTKREAVRLNLIDEGHPLTLLDVEQIYHDHGIRLGGDCEMRQKWYPSNMAPRTYYAMGGDAYHKSKYVQRILNDLCETIDPTSKVSCVIPERLELDQGEYVYIYDLTSFTSNLHEQKSFLQFLSLKCKGVSVTLCDSWLGYIQKDLGELISEYSELYQGVRLSLERMRYTYRTEVLVIEQEVASLLGIYGNITSARFLHGIVMLQVASSEKKLNAAGDDGVIATKSDMRPYSAICTMGEMEMTKSSTTKEIGSICLKRPIDQWGNRIYVGQLDIWPSLEYPRDVRQIDNRYLHLVRNTPDERTNSTCGSVLGFLKQLAHREFSIEDKQLVKSYLKFVYDRHHLSERGSVPQISGEGPFVCCTRGDFIGKDPISYTIDMNYDGLARLPVRDEVPFHASMLRESTFECTGSARLSYLCKMGYFTYEKKTKFIVGDMGLDLLKLEFVADSPVVNVYSRVCNVPDKLMLE